MNIAPSPRRMMGGPMMGNAAHQKMESIGEISNETSSSTRSGSQQNYKSAKTADNHHHNNNNNKEPVEPSSPHKKSFSSNEPSPTCVVSLVLMSGERVDVSNLVPESERTPERLNRRRVKQLIKPNETVYPKLPDPMLQDDNGIDLQMLLEQHQRKQQNSPTPPSRRMVELEQPPQRSPNNHSNGYPTLPVVGSNSNNNNDRRTRWQHEPTFAQHSFERRQQERSHQQERTHQFATHKDNVAGRGQHYPYARADSRHQQQFASVGENNNNRGGGVSDEIALDRRSHQRWEAAYGEQQSSRTRTIKLPSPEPPVEYEYPYQHHHAHLQQQHHHHHHAQYRGKNDDRSQPQQHYPYGNGWDYPSTLSEVNSSDPQFGRRREQRARERPPQQQHHEYQPSADGHDGYGGVYERNHAGGNGHASMYEFRMSRDLDRGQDYPQPSQRQQQQQPQGPTPHNNNKKNLEVEIAPGVMARLRGADETTVALQQGRVVASDCLCCGARSLCIDDASYLLCPVCKVVNPLCNNVRGDTSGGVGLGILEAGY